jgi:guanyl-specific ribonuclease Sa
LGPPTQKVLNERAARDGQAKPLSTRAVFQTGEDRQSVEVSPEEYNSGMAEAGKALVDTAGQLGDAIIPGFAQGRKAIDNIIAGNYEEAGKNVVTGAAEVGITYMGGKLIQSALVAAFPLANPPISAGQVIPETTAKASGKEGARATTDYLSDVTVTSRGKVVGQGTVDLRGVLDDISTGKAPVRDVFQNRERLLPAKAHGYYKEFTVPTPGVKGAGSQRIIQGTGGELFYTPDHYSSFVPLN